MSAAGNPSRLGHRLPLAGLALVGLAVAAYLAAFQAGLVTRVWEPLFGDGSRRILTSDVARALPVPDAALGALGYLADAVLALVGGENRWRRRPWLVLAFGAVVGAMALGGIGLVAVQAIGFRTGCTLCLGSAAISIALAAFAWPEVAGAVATIRGHRTDAAPGPRGGQHAMTRRPG